MGCKVRRALLELPGSLPIRKRSWNIRLEPMQRRSKASILYANTAIAMLHEPINPTRCPAAFDRWQLPTHVAEAVWRGSELGAAAGRTVPSGHPALDAALPGQGWPTACLSDVLMPQAAVCEWRLLGPSLAALLAEKGSCLYLVAPPKQPHAMGLAQLGVKPEQLVWIDAKGPADRLWVTEQLLKSEPVGAVLAWLPQARPEQIRRLQLNAHSCDAPVFLFRPETAVRDTSAAPLRLSAKPGMGWQIDVQIIKRRGAPLEDMLHLDAMPSNLGIVIPPRLRNLAQPALIPGSEVTHVLGRFSPAQLDGVRVAN